eukprot:1823685-Alexandrium_andersonii.AAC.1
MSASLVGSEMCIRDSQHDGPLSEQDPSCAKMDRRRIAGRQARGTAPVSYTHLTLPTICSV